MYSIYGFSINGLILTCSVVVVLLYELKEGKEIILNRGKATKANYFGFIDGIIILAMIVAIHEQRSAPDVIEKCWGTILAVMGCCLFWLFLEMFEGFKKLLI